MHTDINENINSIVKNVKEEKYRECMGFYQSRVELYRYQIEEQQGCVGEVTRMTKEELEGKVN